MDHAPAYGWLRKTGDGWLAIDEANAASAGKKTTRSIRRDDRSGCKNVSYHRRVPWYAYVLVSAAGRTYVGTSNDVERRLRQHNGELAGGARTTRAGRPWLIGRVLGPFASRGDAVRCELRLRRLRGARRLVAEEGSAIVPG
jgi:putative endonuclease